MLGSKHWFVKCSFHLFVGLLPRRLASCEGAWLCEAPRPRWSLRAVQQASHDRDRLTGKLNLSKITLVGCTCMRQVQARQACSCCVGQSINFRIMSSTLLSTFEQYQKARVQFVQAVAEAATRPQNIDTMQNAGVMQLLRPLLLDNVSFAEVWRQSCTSHERFCTGS